MKERILSLSKFIALKESLSDSSTVRDILLKNKQKITVEAEISDEVFNALVDQMTQDEPESLIEDDLVNDAIVFSKELAKSSEYENKAIDSNNNLDTNIPQF